MVPVHAVLTRLSDVQAEPVTWLWRGRVPRGKMTLLAGDPGLGKSLMLLDLAARITRGGALPGGGEVPVGDVVVLSAEDGPADTIRRRCLSVLPR
jgi:putative DNA primase/helicase